MPKSCVIELDRLMIGSIWLLVFLPFLLGVAPVTQPSQQPTTQPTRWGCDSNLTRRCVRAPHPGRPNYYEDVVDCRKGGKSWTIAVQSETIRDTFSQRNQSFLVNGPGSPVRMDWLRHTDEQGERNWMVQLTTDFLNIDHPGGGDHFTWFVLMDHVGHNGGPLPPLETAHFHAKVRYRVEHAKGATRAFVGLTAFWDGKARGVEVCFHKANWGDAEPPADVIARIDREELEFVTMDGTAMGMDVPAGRETALDIDWLPILESLTKRNYLTAPSRGWDATAHMACYVGTEVNNFEKSNGARISLMVTDWRMTGHERSTRVRDGLRTNDKQQK